MEIMRNIETDMTCDLTNKTERQPGYLVIFSLISLTDKDSLISV